MYENFYAKAVFALVPNANAVVADNRIVDWQDDRPQPTKEQILAKIKELEAEEVKKTIKKRATNFVKKQLKELDYDSEGEVALYAANQNSEWHNEAVALQKWIEDVYKKMYELQEGVTVDNYKDIDLDKIEAEYSAFK